MADAKRDLVRAWLIKARNDLDTATQIGGIPTGHLDTAIYHCQQAAEKAVKGFLAFRDHRLERSHDIEQLATLASAYEAGFVGWIDVAILLTPYATAYRYPGASAAHEPDRAEFEDALDAAASFVAYVLALLPPDVQPEHGG